MHTHGASLYDCHSEATTSQGDFVFFFFPFSSPIQQESWSDKPFSSSYKVRREENVFSYLEDEELLNLDFLKNPIRNAKLDVQLNMSKMKFLLLPKLASTTVFSISRNRSSTFSPSSNYMEVLTTAHHSIAKAWCKLPSLLLIITHISTLSPHFPCASQAICIQFSSVQSLSHVRLFATP